MNDATRAATQGSDNSDPMSKLAELEAKHAEVSDAYLRAKAEAENIRRRAEEEISKARKFAVEGFAESLLPVKDSLEAAIAIPAATPEQLLEGVHATLRQLATALERNRVIEINPAAGAKFDPHQHQAISVVPADQEARREAQRQGGGGPIDSSERDLGTTPTQPAVLLGGLLGGSDACAHECVGLPASGSGTLR